MALVALAAWLAALVVLAVQLRLPHELNVTTDVVSFPTYANFNVSRYFHVYYLVVLLLPAATLAFYVALCAVGRSHWRVEEECLASGPAQTVTPMRSQSKNERIQVARALFVGSVLGLEAAIVTGWTGAPFGALVLVAAGVYLAILSVVGQLTANAVFSSTPPSQRRSAMNAALAPAVVIGLSAVSASTEVVRRGSAPMPYPWLPLWLSLPAALVVAAVVRKALARSDGRNHVHAIERRVLLLVITPVFLFVLMALLPGPLGGMDVFHEGEWLVGGDLLRRGWFPWRDFAVIHGALADALMPALGMRLFESSRWGMWAGFLLVLIPLYWLANYYFAAFVFRRNWIALFGSVLVTVVSVDISLIAHLRFILWPLILLALAAVLRDGRSWHCALFVALVVTQALLTPEAVYAAVATGATIVLFEVIGSRRGRSIPANFHRTLRCAGITLISTAAWFGFLATQGAADDYVRQALTFARDHRLVGGIPMRLGGIYFPIAVVAPVAGIILALSCLAAKARRRRPFSIDDWLLVAAASMVALYYQKFLARADAPHAGHVLAAAVPMLLILLDKGLTRAETAAARWHRLAPVRRVTEYPVTLFVALAIAALVPASLPERVSVVPRRLTATASAAPIFPRLGYAQPRWFDKRMMDDVATVLGAYLRPGEPIFDFTNQPGFIHYLLGYPPATRYYHVSMAVRRDTQRDLIAQLVRARPRLVVFQNDQRGFPSPDGVPNIVRHYEVSQYLLDNYQPWLAVHRYILLVPRELDTASLPSLPATLPTVRTGRQLLFEGYPCDWRNAANFLTSPDADEARAVSIRLVRVGPRVTRLQLPPGTDLTRFRWLEIRGAPRLRADSFSLKMPGDPLDPVLPSIPGEGLLPPGGPYRTIRFRSLDRQSLRVRVGSCPAWHAYTGSSLDLVHAAEQDIAAVRLLP